MAKSKLATGNLTNVQALEVAWYRIHGKYPERRIRTDSMGKPYVIGDWSWHRGGNPVEYIEDQMTRGLRDSLHSELIEGR